MEPSTSKIIFLYCFLYLFELYYLTNFFFNVFIYFDIIFMKIKEGRSQIL